MLKANGVSSSKSPTKANDDGSIPTPSATPVKRKAAAPRTPGSSAKKPKGKAGKMVKKEEEDDESGVSSEDTKQGVKTEEETESDLSGTVNDDSVCDVI